MESFPLESTLYLPLAGDPPGFNHFTLAEWTLRTDPEVRRVVFLLSNGHHPDPKKADATAPAALREALLREQIAEVADPERSWLARLAAEAGEPLHIGPDRLAVSTLEMTFDRPVRTAESMALLRGERPGRVQLAAGTDLVRRMADPAIFSDEDVHFLAQSCRYRVFERETDPAAVLAELERTRGARLEAMRVPRAGLPDWLRPFLELASTRIREAAEAGDPLGGMVTRSAAERIAQAGLYREGKPRLTIVDLRGHEVGSRSALELRLEELKRELWEAAAEVAAILERDRHHPRTLAIVETAVGGALTRAFAARSGASRYFVQSRFAYDRRAKAELVGEAAGEISAVSEEMVAALAEGIRDRAGAHIGLAESGMAGPPDGQRRSHKSGQCWIALATRRGTETLEVRLNPFLTRREHQLRFAIHALRWLEERLSGEETNRAADGGPP